jgi:hypothetical protein
MKASEFDVGNYLNSTTAGLLVGKDLLIYEVKAEEVREKKKMLIGFEGVDKGLIVNKTNRMIMVEAHGDETDDWVGHTVRIEITKRMYQGKPLPGILLVPQVNVERKGDGTTKPTTAKKARKAPFEP